jgi:putative PIN family toxin of toxin-antitoxin system
LPCGIDGIIYNTTVAGPLVLLDTNIVVAGLRSRNGAAFRVLSLVGTERFEICLSVPVILEYEMVLLDQLEQLHLTASDIDDFLDYFCSVGRHQEVHYLWRPYLKDPKDDLVLEAAVAGGCEAIITYNRRDFAGVEKFGVRILTPGEFLRRIGEL